MATSFAALLFRPSEVSDRALAQGFAVALAGWDAPAPRLSVAALPSLPGYCAAFYASGAKLPRGAENEEIEHAIDLFEDELPPALAVLDAAQEEGHPEAVVHAIVFAEEIVHDSAWRFDRERFERRFVREGDDGLEAGVETPEAGERVGEVDLDPADEAAIKPHRGSTYLANELGAPVLSALVRALFDVERRLEVRMIEPDPASIAEETRRLARVLGREPGRGAFEVPAAIAGVVAPDAYRAMVAAYDWADPADPADLYRGLAIGAIEGALRFLREGELRAIEGDAAWAAGARAGAFPIAKLVGTALGGASAGGVVGIAAKGADLVLVKGGRAVAAGPTLGELLAYLALGWSQRSEAEEDRIGALMLRAKLRAAS